MESFRFEPDEELEAFRLVVRRLAKEKVAPRARELDEVPEFPWDLYQLLGQNRLLGLTLPEEFGGEGSSFLALCVACEELARASGSFAPRVAVASLVGEALINSGTRLQKERYVPGLASGEILPAVAMTEPEAGSDLLALRTSAERVPGGWKLRGTKRFITNADVAHLLFTVARMEWESASAFGIFLLERGTPGVVVSRTEEKMAGAAFHACEVVLEEALVPEEGLLGGGPVGPDFVQGLGKGRVVVGAVGVGLAAEATEVASIYAHQRIQFGRPIVKFQGVSFLLADMLIQVEAARGLVYRAAWLYDRGDPRAPAFAAMAKCHATDTAMWVATNAVQVLGGYGYTKEFPVERMMREAKLLQIYEGTNQIQRVILARHLPGA